MTKLGEKTFDQQLKLLELQVKTQIAYNFKLQTFF